MLKKQVRDYDDTFSAWDVIIEHFKLCQGSTEGFRFIDWTHSSAELERSSSKRKVVGSNPTGSPK